MKSSAPADYPANYSQEITKSVNRIFWILIAFSILLGLGHCFLTDLKWSGVYWFNMDKERNLATWYSGAVFFIFGLIAAAAGHLEMLINVKHRCSLFRLPVLWVGIAAVGIMMSLDEMTILHENLFWKEVRQFSENQSRTMVFLTQWQILFLPVIIPILTGLIVFWSHRYQISRKSAVLALSGIAVWIFGISAEAVRNLFKLVWKQLYVFEVAAEEMAELIGTLLIIQSIFHYIIQILPNFHSEQPISYFKHDFINKNVLQWFVIFILVLIFIIVAAWAIANSVSMSGADIPTLHQRALQ